MSDFKLISVTKSSKKGKKYDAKFENKKTKRTKTISFGAAQMDDYTITKDKEQRERYRMRHKKDLETKAPTRAGYLSYYLLWGNSISLRENIKNYRKRFGL